MPSILFVYVMESTGCNGTAPLATQLSFLTHLKVDSCTLAVLWCHVILTYLFSAEVTTPTKKLVFLLNFIDL